MLNCWGLNPFLKHEGKWRQGGRVGQRRLQAHISGPPYPPNQRALGHHNFFMQILTSYQKNSFLFNLLLLDFEWESKGHSFEISCYSYQDHLLQHEACLPAKVLEAVFLWDRDVCPWGLGTWGNLNLGEDRCVQMLSPRGTSDSYRAVGARHPSFWCANPLV